MENNLSTIEDKLARCMAEAVKGRRMQLGLTLRTLADKSGISSSMISDIERGTKSPTVSTLYALARAMDVPMAALIDEADAAGGRVQVSRASERPEFVDQKSGMRRDSIGAPIAGSKVEFVRCAVPAHKIAGPFAAHAHGTIEHMYVASGSMRAIFGSEAVTLDAGDSCSCHADAPHQFDNSNSDVEALIYIVVERP
ncbi:XRE family transcriptional regulator [Microbacteriaceae bacterium K1510]|nr:XRE family transcriptional regulator [Microbacteriaceae bacterium K1510]